MKFWESFVLIYMMVFVLGWTMWGLHVNDAYLYMNIIITLTLIIAFIGLCIERNNINLKQEEIKMSWENRTVDWTETEENRTDVDREI